MWEDQAKHPWLDLGLERVGGQLGTRLTAAHPDEDQGYSPFNVGGRWRHWEFLWLDKDYTRLVAFKPFYPHPNLHYWEERYYRVEYVPDEYRDMMIEIDHNEPRARNLLAAIYPPNITERILHPAVSGLNRPPSKPMMPLEAAAWVAVSGMEIPF